MRKDYLIKSITQYIFFFFLGAFLGYLWEVLLFYVQDGVFCNRGFLYGPWLPVYGVGAVLMLLILRRFQKHPVKVFFLAVLLGSFVELFIGWFIDQVFHLRYWDYHDYPLQLGGYIFFTHITPHSLRRGLLSDSALYDTKNTLAHNKSVSNFFSD